MSITINGTSGVEAGPSVKLNGSTSGTVILQAPAIAGSTVLTMPSTNGTLALASEISYTQKFIVDNTDIQLSTPANIGSPFTAIIPANGIIRMASFSGRFLNDATTGAHNVYFGIKIGTSSFYHFPFVIANGTSTFDPQFVLGTVANAYTDIYGSPIYRNGANSTGPVIDITGYSIPTGLQTIQLTAYYTASVVTLKGTVKPTRVCLEIIGQ